MSTDKRIHRITLKKDGTAEAQVTLAGNAEQTISSSGLAELRKQLYAAGFSKRAISAAVKAAETDTQQ